MGLLTRLMGKETEEAPRRRHGFAADARAMRLTLDGLHAELERVNGRGAPGDLRPMLRGLPGGEGEGPTGDVAELIRLGEEPDAFYEREVKASWEGLGE